VVVVLVEAIVSKVASREDTATDKEEITDVVVASKTMVAVVVVAADLVAMVLDVVVPVAKVVARYPAITLLLMRTCFNTGTRLESRTSVRRLRCYRKRSSTLSLKSTTRRWLLEELLLTNRVLELVSQPHL
jgi:hypothetical protein